VPERSIDDAALVASLLSALGGPRHEQALAALLDMTEGVSSGATHGHIASK
jgi:hypothetical protein